MSWTYIGTTVAKSTSSQATLAATLSSSVSAGQLVVLAVSGYVGGGFTGSTVSDTLGNTWTKIAETYTSDMVGSLYYSVITNAGTPTITYTPNESLYMTWAADIWSCGGGISTSTQAITGSYSAAGTVSSGSISFTSAGNYLIWGFMGCTSTSPSTAGSGFTATSITPAVGGAQENLITEYQLLTSSSSPLAITAGLPSTSSWVCGGAAFLETITGGHFAGSALDGLSAGGPFFSSPLGRI